MATAAQPIAMTVRELLDATVRKSPDSLAMRFRRGGAWASRSYGEFHARSRQVAEVIGRMGVVPGRDPVALILENRPEWMEISAGILGAGVTLVPLDPKLKPAEMAFILGDAGVVAVFVGVRHRATLESILPGLPAVSHVVFVDGGEEADAACAGRASQDYEAALAAAAAAAAGAGAWYDRHRPEAGTVALIVYTSGTTGKPKGAMLSHGNLCADIEGCFGIVLDLGIGDSFLVVLPLFHSFSFTTNFVIPISRGSSMEFVESLRTVSEDIRLLRPTVMMAVPLLIEKIYQRIDDRIRASRCLRLLLAVGLGRVIGARVRKTLGGRLRYLIVGGAPCPVHVLRGFRRLGIGVIEGYGLTEASPVVSLSRPDDARPGTIGYKLPNIDVRIAGPDARGVGELQVRGPIVMQGYYRNPAATAEAFDDGWLRTGDLASIDGGGYITVRGRRKALIVNREGKNIYPEEVEQCIARHPDVLDVVVIGYHEGGETGERVGAIVTPNLEAIHAAHGGQEPAWLEIDAHLRQVVHGQCRDLADYKHPRKIDVRREPLERTSTQKVRRHVYQGQLDQI